MAESLRVLSGTLSENGLDKLLSNFVQFTPDLADIGDRWMAYSHSGRMNILYNSGIAQYYILHETFPRTSLSAALR